MPSALSEHNGGNGTKPREVSPTVPGDADAVLPLIQELSSLSEGFNASSIDDKQRLELAKKTKKLLLALETPRETMIRHCWAQPTAFTAIAAGVQTGVWNHVAKCDGAFNAADVAKELNIDSSLLCRFLRHLSALGYLKELAPNTYEGSSFTKTLALTGMGDGYPIIAGHCMASLDQFHEYSQKNGWKEPNSISDGPYQHAFKTDLNFFQYIQGFPHYSDQFNNHMSAYHQGRPSWMDVGFFPVKEKLVDGFDTQTNSVMLVDIGGSTGHDIDEFRRKHPDAPGRLILQDLPSVIDSIQTLDARIERMGYDFNTEQPITGARAYYMHSVLHDWPDEACLKILSTVKKAMKPGYSRLLINENVIPDFGAHWEATSLDIMMMMLVSARERTLEHWRDLITKSGLGIVQVYSASSGAESLIECELA